LSQRALVRSGNAPLDRQIGGLLPGRPYLLSGAPGTGKSVSCLEFLDVAVQEGEVAVLLTHDDPKDVLATAAFLGIDLEPALADGRFVLLRFQLDFARRFGRAATPDEVFEELERLLGDRRPSRLAIDSVVPFLEGGGASSTAVFALTAFLERLGATALLTYPGDLSGLYDRRLEPLMQRAGGFFHLASQSQGRRRGVAEIRKLRYEAPSMAPVQFRIEPGAGFVQEGAPNEPETPTLEAIRRRVLVVNLSAPFPEDLLKSASRDFEVTVRAGIPAAFSELVRAGVGAVLLNVQRDVIRDALELVRELRRSDVRTPILVVTPYVLRSTDRTRALRAGADDFVSLTLPHEEILARVAAITRRGRSTARLDAESERPLLAQPRAADGGYEVLPAERFATAVSAYLSQAQAPFFTLLELHPSDGNAQGAARLALETSRVDSGDLVGLSAGGAMLLADGARPRELEGLQQRLRSRWAEQSGGALAITALSLPTDEDRIRGMFARTGA
jgi:KaiC/GvpD/RAD55 family RecA-like ATPase/DNA-binding response OmpR family regulator